MHPLLEEICRVNDVSRVQAHVFRRWQQQLRDVIQPVLDAHDARQAAEATPEPVPVAAYTRRRA